jgi:hypothetical protein
MSESECVSECGRSSISVPKWKYSSFPWQSIILSAHFRQIFVIVFTVIKPLLILVARKKTERRCPLMNIWTWFLNLKHEKPTVTMRKISIAQ